MDSEKYAYHAHLHTSEQKGIVPHRHVYYEDMAMKLQIVKTGTESVLTPGMIEKTVQSAHELILTDINVFIVSSGAIAYGAQHLAYKTELSIDKVRKKYTPAILSLYGNTLLMREWESEFAKFGISALPLQVTHSNLADVGESHSLAKNIFQLYTEKNVVVIANENDFISDTEIRYMRMGLGENDKLSFIIARLLHSMEDIDVEGVLFGTHAGGYYTANPDEDKNAVLVPEIHYNTYPHTDWIDHFLYPGLNEECVIGNNMHAKICAALLCAHHMKIGNVAIAHPDQAANLMLRPDDFVGTRVLP